MPRLLSHPFGPETPPFNGDPPPSFEPLVLIERGEPSNNHRVTTVNHIGTHIDAPWHFNPAGRRLTELEPDWFVYRAPVVVDVPAADATLISPDDLQPHAGRVAEADLLLVRTGFAAACRAGDPARFGSRNPGFAPDCAEWLMAFGSLRLLAMDTPSALCPEHAEAGYEFHRRMLGRAAEDRFILIAEDVRIDVDLTDADLERGVVVAPLLLDRLDGAPATILAL